MKYRVYVEGPGGIKLYETKNSGWYSAFLEDAFIYPRNPHDDVQMENEKLEEVIEA